mgnify:CR=1 FL=1
MQGWIRFRRQRIRDDEWKYWYASELLDDDTVAVVWCIPVTTEPSSSVLAALAADGFRVEQR